jgi:uncharacterized protein (DUF2237 family)
MICATCGAEAGAFYPYTGREVPTGKPSLWYPGEADGQWFCSNGCGKTGFARFLRSIEE